MTDPLEEAYVAHADELIRYATAIVGPDDATDVVVDTMVKVFGGRGDELAHGEDQHLRAYLFRAVYTGALDHERARERRRRRETSFVRRTERRTWSEPNVSLDARRALDRLSEQQRAAVFLVYWCDHTADDAAELLGVSSGTVRKQLARARARLREVLDVDV